MKPDMPLRSGEALAEAIKENARLKAQLAWKRKNPLSSKWAADEYARLLTDAARLIEATQKWEERHAN